MKYNWRVLIAIAVIVVAAFWSVDSVRSRSYSGVNLNFGVGSGPVTVTNPSSESVSVQLAGSGTRPFSVSSTAEGVSGSSTRAGSGRNTTQVLEFMLPSGVSEFTVARGSNVNFAATTDTRLQATVEPQGSNESRTTLIAGAVVILGGLFYISRATGHGWLGRLRRSQSAELAAERLAERQTFKRMFGRVSSDKS